MAGTPQDSMTVTEYRAFEHAYQSLSTTVFTPVLGQPLPPCLITLQRRGAAYGSFCRDRFIHRHDGCRRIDEIALNPDMFPLRTDKEILSTLAHEAVHCYQRWYGTPGRRGYHNRQWAAWMEAIGLMPSNTGQPGGHKMGERVTHYILPGGAFDQAMDALLATGLCVQWQTGSLVTHPHQAPAGNEPSPPHLRRKTTFTCPQCTQKAWAKPTAQLVCGRCGVRLHA